MNHKVILSLLLFLMTGCSQQINIIAFSNPLQPTSYFTSYNIQPKSVVALAQSNKSHNAIIVANDHGEVELDKVRESVPMPDARYAIPPSTIMSKKEFNARFGFLLNALPPEPLSYQLYFKSNHMTLTHPSNKLLPTIVNKIIELSPCVVDIIGHTDTTGEEDENFDISFEEANNVKSILQEEILQSLTCKKDITLVVKGYGEKDLLIPTADNTKEKKNRFVEIYIK